MIRKLLAKFSQSLSGKMVSSRRRHTAPIKVWFEPERNTERLRELAKSACILGETVDISRTGIAFLVSSIRLQEKYLVGQERGLNIEIDLPNGRVHLQAIGRRYEKVGMHTSAEGFLVGAHILKIDINDEKAFLQFLTNRSRSRKAAGNLELGID